MATPTIQFDCAENTTGITTAPTTVTGDLQVQKTVTFQFDCAENTTGITTAPTTVTGDLQVQKTVTNPMEPAPVPKTKSVVVVS